MKRSHRIIFALIALLAIATFLFGVLQFLAPGREPASPALRPETNDAAAGPTVR